MTASRTIDTAAAAVARDGTARPPQLLPHPYTDAPIWSRLLFHWPVSLLRLGMQRPLQTTDLWECLPMDTSARNLALFQQLWQHEQEYCRNGRQEQQQQQSQSNKDNHDDKTKTDVSIKPSLRRALVRDFFLSTWFVQPLMMLASAAKIVQAVALGRLIDYFEHASQKAAATSFTEDSGVEPTTSTTSPVASTSSYADTDGYMWATVLVTCGLFVLFEHHHVFFWTWRKGMQIRIACVAAIYEKSLRLSSVDAETSASYGKIMNLASNDVERFLMASLFGSYLFWAPLQALAILVVGCISLQDAVAFGSGFALLIVFFAPLQFYLSKSFAKHRSTIAAITDKRVQFCSQAVRGARVMKMSGYEQRFLQRIQDYRQQEMQQIQKAQNLKAYNEAIFFCSNVVISVVIFFVHVVLMGGYLDPGNVFTVFTLVNILQLEVTKHVSMGVMGCSECNVSVQRIQNFLEFPEVQVEKVNKQKLLLTDPSIVGASAITASEESSMLALTVKLTNDNSAAATERGDIIISMKNVTCYWDHVNASSLPSSSLSVLPLPPDCEVTVGDNNDVDSGGSGSGAELTTLTCQQEKVEEGKQPLHDEAPLPFSLALKDISLDFRRGQLTSIIGTVGSGKSALLQAIIRELPLYSGTITMHAGNDDGEDKEDAFPTIAYAAQDPWIMDGTVRENIIMGGCRQRRRRKRLQNSKSQETEPEYLYEDAMDELSDEEWYQQVIEACSLLPDLEQFRHGDATIVGDRGVQCSGGQRARIGLARALYRNADILVADDPLSAVDAKVGRQLFQIAIMKLSVQRNKCVILATHQHQYINLGQDEQEQELDKVCQCVLITAGRLECIGTYHECIAASNGKLTAHTADDAIDGSTHGTEASSEIGTVLTNEVVADDNVDESDAAAEAKNLASLAADEQKEISNHGIVRFDTYINYLKAMGGVFVGLLLAVLFSVTQASVLFTIASVGRWAEQPPERQSDWEHVGLVVGMAGVVVILAVGRAFLTLSLLLKASRRLHDRMAESVLRAKIGFFDTNPLGRILNRFSADVGITDDLLPTTWFDFLVVAFIVLGSIVTTLTTLPFALAVLPPLSLYFWRVRSVFVTSTRELKRLEGLARSPIFAMLGESLGGIATIRSNNFLDYFRLKFREAHDAHTKAFFAFISASRWVGFRMDSLVYSFLVIVSYLSLFVQQKQWFDIDPAILGLSISFLLYLAGLFQWCIRQSAEVVNQMVSVERILAFGLLEPEAALTKPSDQDLVSREEWPSQGAIEFDNVSVRYRPSLPLVLEGVSFNVPACSRVGIVGRTGSGKSTVVQTLFRLLEAENGRIVIDGVDISKLGLHALRTKISVIPQVPTLFSGCSVRENLDLFGLHSDEALRQVLESCHLTHVIDELPQGWDSLVSEGGSNFSVGQRQLLCLARAVLSQNKILVLDEATASVDRRTDQMLQEALRKTFEVGTIIAVAHRLETVIDCDCILVLGQGRVLEFGSPAELLRRPPTSNNDDGTSTGVGSFASMVQDTGETTARELRQRAFQKEAEANATTKTTGAASDSPTTDE